MNKQTVEQTFRQRGSALILTIMMMMALGLLGLNTVNQYLNAALALTRSDKNYFQSWERAVSSLNWGLSQSWKYQATSEWQCIESLAFKEPQSAHFLPSAGQISSTQNTTASLRSCVKPADTEGIYVLRGGGQYLATALNIYVYQLATMQTAALQESRFKPLVNGWLDFCPLKDEANCHE